MKIDYRNPIIQTIIVFILSFIISITSIYIYKPNWVKIYDQTENKYIVSDWLVVLYSFIISICISIIILFYGIWRMSKKNSKLNV